MQKAMLQAIDVWMKHNPGARSRPEAIRKLVELGLKTGKKVAPKTEKKN
jgi:hypothetical protein